MIVGKEVLKERKDLKKEGIAGNEGLQKKRGLQEMKD